MKKKLLFVLLFSAISMSAQIKVQSAGQIGIGDTIHNENKLTLLARGPYESGLTAISYSTKSWGPAIFAKSVYQFDRQVALMAYALTSTPMSSGRSYGVLAAAGNRTPGYNYAVYGILTGSNNGAGIVGAVGWSLPVINGMYAGYFSGNVHVTNTITAQTFTTLSDARYKSNIRSMESDALAKVRAFNPVQYTMLGGDAIAFANSHVDSDTASVVPQMVLQNDINDTTTHYGLLAQEVKEIYPELVYEDAAGVMSINYIELIPLLIKAIQDLSDQVGALSSGNTTMHKSQTKKSVSVNDIVATLYQNTPNPFTDNTIISYVIPAEVQVANIYIYDMTGVQLACYPITTFGEGTITINANELYAGSFLYSLVIDGKLIDTKQMVLTK